MWLILFLTFSCLFFFEWYQRLGRYPPGPPPWPIVGNLPAVIIKSRKSFVFNVWREWSLKYGKILGLKLGLVNIVVVFGKDYIKEVSTRDVFDGRPHGFFYKMRSYGKKIGIVFGDGPRWVSTKRIVLKFLKNFGYNSSQVESYIEEECQELVRLRMTDKGRAVEVTNMFNVSIVNIVWRIVAGERYDLDDNRLKYLTDLIMKLFKTVDMSGGVLNFMPFLRHLMPDLTGYTKVRDLHNKVNEFVENVIEEHEKNFNLEHPKDVIDAFLIAMSEQKDQILTKQDLHIVCRDLLEAGLETVSNTTSFMILYLVREQEIQRKMQQEIDEIVGHHRTPTVKERPRMVYTEAVIQETLRISSVAPVGIPHVALEEAQLGNYIIPKGTYILLAMHDLHNGNDWDDPGVFRPERFLTKDRNLVQNDSLMAFGIGKRRCIGEGLARSELFMFITHLLQRFNLVLPQDDPLPSVTPLEGLSLSPKPFRVIFEPRY